MDKGTVKQRRWEPRCSGQCGLHDHTHKSSSAGGRQMYASILRCGCTQKMTPKFPYHQQMQACSGTRMYTCHIPIHDSTIRLYLFIRLSLPLSFSLSPYLFIYMSVDLYVHICIYIRTHIHLCVHTCIYVCVYVCIYIYIFACVNLHIGSVSVYCCTIVDVYVCIPIYIYMYEYIYIYHIHIYIFI